VGGQHGSQRKEHSIKHRQLNQQRQTARRRAYTIFFINFLHRLVLRALVLGVFLLHICYQRLDRLHCLRRLELLHVQRKQSKANNDRQDNDGEAQVTKEVIEQHQHIKDRSSKDCLKKVAYKGAYLSHEIVPAFLDLVSQAFWDRIIQTAMI
jgi:hypothetical protein